MQLHPRMMAPPARQHTVYIIQDVDACQGKTEFRTFQSSSLIRGHPLPGEKKKVQTFFFLLLLNFSILFLSPSLRWTE